MRFFFCRVYIGLANYMNDLYYFLKWLYDPLKMPISVVVVLKSHFKDYTLEMLCEGNSVGR